MEKDKTSRDIYFEMRSIEPASAESGKYWDAGVALKAVGGPGR